jgi:cleavage stimulation factor subunit 2
MVTDLETGKKRGFAFVEFENAQDALSAIRNMNEYELNGRKIRVNFSNSSHLETLAGQLGMDMSSTTNTSGSTGGAGMGGSAITSGGKGGINITNSSTTATSSSSSTTNKSSPDMGTQAVAQALKAMSKGEMYDVLAKLKEMADHDPDEARKVISAHPQLPEAILYCMSQLDMIKTPLDTSVGAVGVSVGVGGLPVPPSMVPPPPPPTLDSTTTSAVTAGRVDPRMAAAAAAASSSSVPPPVAAVPIDPRLASRASDPRAAAAAAASSTTNTTTTTTTAHPPPPPPPPQMYMPVPQPPPQQQPQQPPSFMSVAGIDPTLAQQVMALTPAQIAQLPVDKQNSILALRQQIQQSMSGGVS